METPTFPKDLSRLGPKSDSVLPRHWNPFAELKRLKVKGINIQSYYQRLSGSKILLILLQFLHFKDNYLRTLVCLPSPPPLNGEVPGPRGLSRPNLLCGKQILYCDRDVVGTVRTRGNPN